MKKRNPYVHSWVPASCTATKCPVAGPGETAKTFCKSDIYMNWWSAFNWYKSNGGTLASFASMCPGVATIGNTAEGTCPALQGTGPMSSIGGSDSSALIVNLSSGALYGNNRSGLNAYALCE